MSQQKKDTNTSSSRSQGQQEQQQFNILPHPAVCNFRLLHGIDLPNLSFQKSNDPVDLVGSPRLGAGLNSKPEVHAYHARDPHVPSQEIINSLEAPKVR